MRQPKDDEVYDLDKSSGRVRTDLRTWLTKTDLHLPLVAGDVVVGAIIGVDDLALLVKAKQDHG